MGDDRTGFIRLPVIGPCRAALGQFGDIETRPSQAAPYIAGTLQIARHEQTLGAVLEFANRENADLHRNPSGNSAFSGTVRTPHFLEIVETAHFGPEDMHDDITCIDEHPIARRLPLHPNAGSTLALQGLDDLIGDRIDMTIRTPGGNDHRIGILKRPKDGGQRILHADNGTGTG